MRKQINSAEYQALSNDEKSNYTRFSGADRVFYELMVKITSPTKETVEEAAKRLWTDINDEPANITYNELRVFQRSAWIFGTEWQSQQPSPNGERLQADIRTVKDYSVILSEQLNKAQAEIERLRALYNFILDTDFLTTKEFCEKYGYEVPSWKGSVELAALEFMQVDGWKGKQIIEKAKAIRNSKQD